jgi:predicted XRE-type DNA-binding protein
MSERRFSQDDKADRALELSEKNLSSAVIAERLGVRRSHVCELIERGKVRRAKLEAAE